MTDNFDDKSRYRLELVVGEEDFPLDFSNCCTTQLLRATSTCDMGNELYKAFKKT